MRTPRITLMILALASATYSLPYTDLSGQYDIPHLFQETVQTHEEPIGQDYAEFFGESQPAFSQEGFTVSCNGVDNVCLSKELCPTGYVSSIQIRSIVPITPITEGRRCRIQDEICCGITREYEGSFVEQEFVTDQKTLEHEEEGTGVALEPSQTGDDSIYQTVEQSTQKQEENPVEKGSESGESSQGVPLIPSETSIRATHLQVGCAAALLCVEEKFCTLDGTISPQPVALTSKQLLRRVPLSTCKNPETGIIGKCCRDPNYVDPWPMGNLPANYSGGFDELGFPTFLSIATARPATKKNHNLPKPPSPSIFPTVKPIPSVFPTVKPIPSVFPTVKPIPSVFPTAKPVEQTTEIPQEQSNNSPQFLLPPEEVVTLNNLAEGSTSSPVAVVPKCGVKNTAGRTPEMEESVTLFGEIPWQAMVLHSEERKILCSGALVSSNSVLTAGNCVDSLSPSDVSIKLGEWKLGYELKHEEPLPFEILNVARISMHPNYARGQSSHDLALLLLDRPATFDYHVNTLCLPETENVAEENRRCITTGWGKAILQAHYTGSVMHAVNVDVLPQESCKNRLLRTDYLAPYEDEAICAKTQKEKNNMCEADVGGPLACDYGRGFYELAGVYSQDNGCQPTNQVAVFAPIDTEWIKKTLTTKVETDNNYRASTLMTDNQYLPPY